MARFRTLIVLLLTLALVMACGDSAPPRHPVLLIGLDGMDWEVALPLLRAGRLPTIGGLMARGIGGELASIRPTVSPTIWTSIATGRAPEDHGIRGFLVRASENTPGGRLYTSLDRRVPAFWNILSAAGRRCHVIGWWNTFPVEPIDGVMVAQVNTLDPNEQQAGRELWKGGLFEGLEGQVHPPDLQEALLAEIPAADAEMEGLARRILGFDGDPPGRLEQRLWDNCLWSFRSDRTYQRIACKLLRGNEPFDVLAVYLGGGDVAGHRFWRYRQPELYEHPPTAEEAAAYGDVIADVYAYLDELVGEILDAAPDDCNVFLVSDHGMRPAYTERIFRPERPMRLLTSGAHREAPAGMFAAAGPDIRRFGFAKPVEELQREDLPTAGSVVDITPTLLALLDLPVGRDMMGSPLEDVLRPSYFVEHPIREVDTHTPPGWFEARQSGIATEHLAEERIEQLRALGYLD